METKKLLFTPCDIQIRESDNGESREIYGCAIRFNEETTLHDGVYYKEREVVLPSACTQEFINSQDVRLNLLHNRENTVARCNKGQGNMTINVREDGVYFTATMPRCDVGDRALEMVRSGVYSGCSFEFREGEATREEKQLSNIKREVFVKHTKFASVGALTLALDPAYDNATCKAREEQLKEEYEKKEAEEQAAKDKEAKDKEEQEKVEQEKEEKQKREAATAERIAAIHREMEILNY